jgi:Mu transposase, C-terminal domain
MGTTLPRQCNTADGLNPNTPGAAVTRRASSTTAQQTTIGEALAIEREHLLPLPSEGFDLVEVSFAHVDGVEVWRQGTCVARHAQSYGRHQEVVDLEHYLDVLGREQGFRAAAGSD